jgi:asparagine synthase (glutamine-hydrolysing)
MCGIVGYAGRPGGINPDLMRAMSDAIRHRGPDAGGAWSSADGAVVLGHRRLAIIDLSNAGAQPMVNSSGSSVVVFNGEIYNHEELRRDLAGSGVRFAGRSDTEVLLAAYDVWGEKCVDRLRGMFAFAIYDLKRKSLFMARDRAGEKPLYWAPHRGGIVFASELKALLTDPEFPRRLSPQGLASYLSFGYVPDSACILEGVHKLPPAHCLTWSLPAGPPRVFRYWSLPPPHVEGQANAETLTDELQSLLTAAVSEQLVADVPLAVLLSGGLDSSIVTAIAAQVAKQRVRTFTVTLPDHPQLDEQRHARTVADHFRTDHVELPLTRSSVDIIATLAAQYDEPIADSSMIPTYLLAKTVSQHCKVVLGGDGGDELFGGYRSYQASLRRAQFQKKVPGVLRASVSALARLSMRPGARGRGALLALSGDIADSIAQSAIWTDAADYSNVSPWLAERSPPNPRSWRRGLVQVARGLPGAAMATDFASYLPEDILVKVDRASMLCSLEVRAPFLDRRVIEFAFGRVPNELRANLVDRKILLKRLATRLLPPALDLTRKQGFTIPISEWLTAEVRQAWQEECHAQLRMLFSPDTVQRLSVQSRSTADEHTLFASVMLTSWMRHYRVAA